MTTKRLLILIPALVILFLCQSYLWVPTYEEQTKGNPDRLHNYITPSLGDATSLNPIISSNATSSQIEALVFEGLLDRDEELRFRGRVARSWEIFEEAYVCVNPAASLPGQGATVADRLIQTLRAARERPDGLAPGLRATLGRIQEIVPIPPEKRTETRRLKSSDGAVAEPQIRVDLQAPPPHQTGPYGGGSRPLEKPFKSTGRGLFHLL